MQQWLALLVWISTVAEKEDGAHRLPSAIADQTSVDAAMAGTSGVNKHGGGEEAEDLG